MSVLAAADAWRWQPHPEVWLILAGVAFLGWYATRVIAPKVVPAGEEVTTARNRRAFWAAWVLLWVASDWPLHDISEEYLYSAHMIQHLLLTFVVPPLFLIATPTWLARLIVLDSGVVSTVIRKLARPIPAGVLFNVVAAFTHWTLVVNTSVDSGPFHYGIHVLVFGSALLMWMPVLGPLPELHLSEPGKMIYLFCMSIIPTIPAAWLTFADNSVYDAYNHSDRLWGIGVVDDQQAAGVVMKIVGGMYLWVLIAIRFFRYSAAQQRLDRNRRRRPVERPLNYADVEAAFEEAGPPAAERIP